MTGTPLAVLVGGGHVRYLIQAADKVESYLRSSKGQAKSSARRHFGYTPELLFFEAIQDLELLTVYEEITEVVAILTERGVVP